MENNLYLDVTHLTGQCLLAFTNRIIKNSLSNMTIEIIAVHFNTFSSRFQSFCFSILSFVMPKIISALSLITDDIRRSKQPISDQNSIYGLGSPFNRHQFDLSTAKPANQYQSQKTSTTTTTTTTSRNSLFVRKSTTTAAPYIASKSTTAVPPSYNSNCKFKP